jgi:kanamycin kinase
MVGALAGPPPIGHPIPAAVTRIADGTSIEPVWLNGRGGLTYRIGDRYLKWSPIGSGLDLEGERERLVWASAFHPVPRILEHGSDNHGEWIITRAIAGESAVSQRWIGDPKTAVRAIGEGLRALHENLPVDGCPFTWSVDDRLDRANSVFTEAPPIDELVVCHGDACAPNTLISANGSWIAHVDFDSMGIADRWADLAVASMSLDWNFGEGWEEDFFEGYGIERDETRIDFYRQLWNADEGPEVKMEQ